MIRIVILSVLIGLTSGCLFGQQPKVDPTPAKPDSVVPIKPIVDKGRVEGHTYTNDTLNFSFNFPETWLIQNDNFEDEIKKQEFELSLAAPDSQSQAARARMNQSLRRVQILVTAYRPMPGSNDIAVLRVSAEDLSANPQIKDAVDYFDAIRESYKAMKLSNDFKYSETQAEKLGRKQFAFLDIVSGGNKKRMYATVRKGFAIMFTLSYNTDSDLATLRQILGDGNFSLK